MRKLDSSKPGVLLRQRWVPLWVVEIQCRRYEVIRGTVPKIVTDFIESGGNALLVAQQHGKTPYDVREEVRDVLWTMFRKDHGNRWKSSEGWPKEP